MAATQSGSYYLPYQTQVQNTLPRFVQSTGQPQVYSAGFNEEPLWLAPRSSIPNTAYSVKPASMHITAANNNYITGSNGLLSGVQPATKAINGGYTMNLPSGNVVRTSNASVVPSHLAQHLVLSNKVGVTQPSGTYSLMDPQSNAVSYDSVRRVHQPTISYQSNPVASRGANVTYRPVTGSISPQFTVEAPRQVQQSITLSNGSSVQLYNVPVGRTAGANNQFPAVVGQHPQTHPVTFALDANGRAVNPRTVVSAVQYQPASGLMLGGAPNGMTNPGTTYQIPSSQAFNPSSAMLNKPTLVSRTPAGRVVLQTGRAPNAVPLMPVNRPSVGTGQLHGFALQTHLTDPSRSGGVVRLAAGPATHHVNQSPLISGSAIGQRVLDFSNAAALRLQGTNSAGTAAHMMIPASSPADFTILNVLKAANANVQQAFTSGSVSGGGLSRDSMLNIQPASSQAMGMTGKVNYVGPVSMGPVSMPMSQGFVNGSNIKDQVVLQAANASALPQEDFRIVLEYVGQHFARMKISIADAINAGLVGGLAEHEKQILYRAHALESIRLLQASNAEIPVPATPGSAVDNIVTSRTLESPAVCAASTVLVAPALSVGDCDDARVSDADVKKWALGPVAQRASSHPSSPVTGRAIGGDVEHRPSSAPPAAPGTPTLVDTGMLVASSLSTADTWSNSSGGIDKLPNVENNPDVEVSSNSLPADQFNAFEYGFFGDSACDGGLLEALEPEQLANVSATSSMRLLDLESKSEPELLQVVAAGSDKFAARFANLDLGCGFFS